MGESDRKGKEVRNSRLVSILMMQNDKRYFYSKYKWAYIAPKTSKITKIHGIPLLHEGYFRKSYKKKWSNGDWVKNLESRLRISQPTKFCRLQNFSQPCKIFTVAHFIMFSAHLSSGF